MVVQHNLTAMNANRYLGINNSKLSKSLEKLSSGYAINRAGDNAAGLAVSEKMRSQIAGMTQGVKNAQDGISMVQTFEGALTETDSILQRMKTLADQAANGTYQDDVDRDAIQLEFDQLNDELNQIADTDFNGVVVLNGGQMADGTVAVDGKFDYTRGYTTTTVANEATDISGKYAHTIVEQQNYTKEIADAVWKAVGADVNKNTTLDVTFMYDGDRWVAQTVTDGGQVVEGTRASGLTAESVERNGATGNGGFKVIAGKKPEDASDIVATNAIFDEMVNVKRGDTVTIRFENSKETTYAPKNAGLDECVKDGKPFDITAADTSTLTNDTLKNKVSFTLGDKVNDAAMTKEMEAVLTALDQMQVKATYDEGTIKAFELDTSKVTDAEAKKVMDDITIENDGTIYYKKDDDTKKVLLGKVTAENIEINVPEHIEYDYAVTGAAQTKKNSVDTSDTDTTKVDNTWVFDATDANKTKLLEKIGEANLKPNVRDITLTFNNTTGGVTAKVNYKDGNASANITGTAAEFGTLYNQVGGSAADNKMGAANTMTITLGATQKTVPEQMSPDPDASGEVVFGLNIDAFNYADMSDLTVHAIATPDVATMKHQVAQQGVSVSNAFKNGAAPLTYTDNITLQTGARSKDAVNFTFKYTSGGMGNLKSNMNCSAREDGLNTASLSLKTAESANYAIDQIDNAINKVSMVRATFGAVQNRLEHKIDNMNVSIENLTSAESQIRDTNMPTEMMNFTKQQILSQAAQSMLAQANQLPQSVLSLLQ